MLNVKDPIQKETFTKKVKPEPVEHNFPKEDKRQTAREQHQNGSTPKSSL